MPPLIGLLGMFFLCVREAVFLKSFLLFAFFILCRRINFLLSCIVFGVSGTN